MKPGDLVRVSYIDNLGNQFKHIANGKIGLVIEIRPAKLGVDVIFGEGERCRMNAKYMEVVNETR